MKAIRPMLAVEADLDKLQFPVYVGVKYDGIRALVVDGVVMSRSMKPIRNKHVQKLFGKPEYNGFDGELVVGDIYAKDVFQKTTSGVMSEDGEPDVKFYVFDYWDWEDWEDADYYTRLFHLLEKQFEFHNNPSLVLALASEVNTKEGLLEYLEKERIKGGEGLIVRNPKAKYKFGRSTQKEGALLKLKFFQQDEFEVIGFEERYHNANEAKVNELGYTERSSSKDNLVPMNTLGSLVLKYGDSEFRCGTGFTDEQRKDIWNNKHLYLGKLASVRYMSVGAKDLPRCPSFVWFRGEDDL